MIKLSASIVVVLGLLPNVFAQGVDSKRIIPVPPEVAAKRKEAGDLRDQGVRLVREGKLEEAAVVLERASVKEDEAFGHSSYAKHQLAKVYEKLGRTKQALDTYRRAFQWNSRWNDLDVGSNDALQIAMDYAILLARDGRAEDAKAIYYFGLRRLISSPESSRSIEPAPFLTVFDADQNGVTWTYTPEALEAAATMAKVMRGGHGESPNSLLKRIKALAPDWFYPALWQAAQSWDSRKGATFLDQAKALAKTDLERQVVTKYEADLVAHRAINLAADTPIAPDRRPMMEGVERRAKIRSLKPNRGALVQVAVGVSSASTDSGKS